ncbi:MAG: FKBP-type peptidyl-prolyl cis-trans isomerase [Deltaproteobacteria bacterium]|nr:FKBP-type peptidyl-prolyl cis-trans isomerase [Deltaproteobacteria bacterium]
MAILGTLGMALLTTQAGAEEAPALKTPKEKLSYAIGADTGKVLRQQEIEVDVEVLLRGLKDGLSGGKLLLTEQELMAIRNAAQSEMVRKQAAQKLKQSPAPQKSAEESKKAGEAFLAGNKTKEGVVALPSGLQYKILKAGDGRKPTDTDVVECNYRGTLIDGKEFDSSYARGKPATLSVAGVIPGWREALKLMPTGSRWQLFIPPHLAYGEQGGGRKIGSNETLILEVELLSIK